jgi:hypothetical protein
VKRHTRLGIVIMELLAGGEESRCIAKNRPIFKRPK